MRRYDMLTTLPFTGIKRNKIDFFDIRRSNLIKKIKQNK